MHYLRSDNNYRTLKLLDQLQSKHSQEASESN